jgi:hypothetical protein
MKTTNNIFNVALFLLALSVGFILFGFQVNFFKWLLPILIITNSILFFVRARYLKMEKEI